MKTIPDVASQYGLPQSTIRDARRRGVFPSTRVGRDWSVDEESVAFLDWLNARQQQSRVKGIQAMAELKLPEKYLGHQGVALVQSPGFLRYTPTIVFEQAVEKACQRLLSSPRSTLKAIMDWEFHWEREYAENEEGHVRYRTRIVLFRNPNIVAFGLTAPTSGEQQLAVLFCKEEKEERRTFVPGIDPVKLRYSVHLPIDQNAVLKLAEALEGGKAFWVIVAVKKLEKTLRPILNHSEVWDSLLVDLETGRASAVEGKGRNGDHEQLAE